MSNRNVPVGRKDEIVIQEVDGEVLIYDLRNDKAFCLNSTSAAIWKLCDGEKSVADIADHVAKEYKATNSEDLVWLALDQLKKEKLIDAGLDAKYDHFNGLSRRQVIRKIGFGSMVALPVVASLVAPSALMAQSSCLANFANCNPPFQMCCSMNCIAGDCCIAGTTVGGGVGVGNTQVPSPNSTCPGVPGANQNAACTTFAGPICCNQMAVASSCTPFPVGANITITCNCAPV